MHTMTQNDNIIDNRAKQFIVKARNKHGDKYDYSKVEYTRSDIHVTIICPIHGDFINRSTVKYENKYDYSKVNYCSVNKEVVIICKKHGSFQQTPQNHYIKEGCPKCISEQRRSMFIQDSILVHGDVYDYSNVDYKLSYIKVTIICKKHGVFNQRPNMHLRGSGCPICKSSHGERLITGWLKNNDISFIAQHTFQECRHINVLPFDFYLPEYNVCIEFQGVQHYRPVEYFGGEASFKKQQLRDEIKRDYCDENNIGLLCIRYSDIDNISDILVERIQ